MTGHVWLAKGNYDKDDDYNWTDDKSAPTHVYIQRQVEPIRRSVFAFATLPFSKPHHIGKLEKRSSCVPAEIK